MKPSKSTDGWLGITDKYWAVALVPQVKQPFQPRFAYFEDGRPRFQSDFLSDSFTVAPGQSQTVETLVFAGAKEVAKINAYEKDLRHPPVRPSDRLGLVLFHHQADVLADRQPQQAARQFRPRHPGDDRHRQGHLLPARQQVLQVDGEHEDGAAEDAGNPRKIRGRQDEAAAGDDGALQDREDQPDRRLLAGAAADPGVLLALQGALRHHRDAACAVLRLDPGSGRAGPDLAVQPVRPAAVRRAAIC